MLSGNEAVVIFALLIIIIGYYLKKSQTILGPLKQLPGPYEVPFLGNIFGIRSLQGVLPYLQECKSKYGSVFQMWAGLIKPIQFAIFLSDERSVEKILGSQTVIEKSFTYKFMHNWLGTGLLTSGGLKWKQRRRIITPTFHFQILEQFVDVFNSGSDILVKKLKKEIGKDSVDIYPYVTLCTLDIICESAMGTKVRAQEESNSEYVYSVKEICRILAHRSIYLPKLYDFLYIFTKDYYKEKRAVKILHDYTDKVIVSRRKLLEGSKKEKTEDDCGIKRRIAFLDLLLQSTTTDGKPLSNEDIREEVDTFMFEGHDTTASAISFALFSLANHPQVQKRAVDEINQIFLGDKTRNATYRDLQEMKYLEQVIKETLRLYPSVPVFGRCAKEAFKIDNTVLPKGLTIFISPFINHRDPKVFPDPEKFDPDRFTIENSKDRSPYAYVPFSAGPRNCIGQKFAMLEIKSTLSKILRNFELLPAHPEHKLCLVPELVLKSANGVRIKLIERKTVYL